MRALSPFGAPLRAISSWGLCASWVTIVFVQDFIVAPSHQRTGIGTQLMRAVMNRFSDVYQMELLTDDGSGACALYESLGFVRGDAMGCVSYVRVAVGPDV